MKKKKTLSLLLTFVLAFSLAACTKPTVQPDPVPNPDDPGVVSVIDDPNVTPEDPSGLSEDVLLQIAKGLEEGEILINDTFEEGESFAWSPYSNGGKFTLSEENGEMLVDIEKPGTLDYSCQTYRDGFELLQDGVYVVSFDIRCDIERPMQWRFQLNGGDYHAYYMEDYVPIGPEAKTVKAIFTMDEPTDPAPRLCFNLGIFDGMDKDTAHKVYIDNFKLALADGSNAKAVEGLADAIPVKVNQIGYKPNDVKKVIATTNDKVTDFTIVNADTKEVVYNGKFADTHVTSKSGDGKTWQGDFSDFKTAGRYVVNVDGLDDSYEFTIAEDVFENTAKNTVKMLYMQRCGCELTSEFAGEYAHKECHTGKAKIYGTNDYIDVTGGWHDAGDYGRYVVPGAKTVEDLFLTYEDSPSSRGDDYDIPESGNGIPDILDEARYELEFMLKMQADNGGVYHKVTCAVFPGVCLPEDETDELIVCPISTTATGDFAAVMAKASVIYKDIDAEFASKCLDASKKAYAYMEENAAKDTTGFINPSDISTGEYPDNKNSDEFIWAAVELFLATGDTAYEDKALEIANSTFRGGLGWADMGTYAMYDYLKAKGVNKNKDLTDKFTKKITDFADTALAKSKEDAYFSSMRDYPWGSNMTIANDGMMYKMMYNLTGKEEYNEYARHQLDYLFGMNPVGYCYVTGEGTLTPEHPHHRPSQYVGKAVPGMLVGGPNSNPADPYAISVLNGKVGGSCYVDNDTAYSINEIAIYWNSPLIYLVEVYK